MSAAITSGATTLGAENPDAGIDLAGPVRHRVDVAGVVQGVGFRPFVAALAAELRLGGSVLNHARGVTIEVEGTATAVADFEARLVAEAPPLARVFGVMSTPADPAGATGFVIAPSRELPGERTLVPPDTATCADCIRELRDPADRRHRHPFITCTNCGPRLSIITGIPYDRAATTMAGFPMCAACAREYADPADRRHHAQPIACHECGPTLTLRDPAGAVLDVGEAALAGVQDALAAGRIVAIKGIGGYHLACDASNPASVQRLRERKRRPDKPFAVMVPDLATAATLVEWPVQGRLGPPLRVGVAAAAAGLLSGPDAPIVLAPKRIGAGAAPVADEIAPGLDELGVVLAYTPVHHLLFATHPDTGRAAPRVLVMTSGNLSDEPLAYDDADALARLGGIADLFLTHDRPIHVPVEDSVLTVDDGGVVPIRRSRGHAPLPVALPALDATPGAVAPSVLAVGAEIKNTCCLTRQDWAFCSAHIGDMGTLESQDAFARTVDQLLDLHATPPTDLAADRHPGYATHSWAQRRADETGLPLHLIQHHHAHLASLLAEHGRLGDRVLGLTFDGTGYGCDGTVWGGEVLLNPGDVTAIRRLGHLSPFALPGGEIAVRRPLRIGLALLDLGGLGDRAPELLAGADPAELALVASQLSRGGQPVTTSVGRLWDGLAAVLGVRHVVTYEAQAAIDLEVLARTAPPARALPFDAPPADAAPADAPDLRLPIVSGPDGLRELDVATLVRDVVAAIDGGVGRAVIARGLHTALSTGAVSLAVTLAAEHAVGTVGLTGGAFANRLLTSGIRSGLTAAGLEVLTHRLVPANDGGLALGQAAIARAIAIREGAP